MGVDVYLEEAAKRVRDAIGALRDEIHTVQSDAYHAESRLHGEIATAQTEAAEVKMEAHITIDPASRALLEARAQKLEAEARHKKDEVTKIGANAARVVQSKTAMLSMLENEARHLESVAATAR